MSISSDWGPASWLLSSSFASLVGMANVILLVWASSAWLSSTCVSWCGKYSISVTESVTRSSGFFPRPSPCSICFGDWGCGCVTMVVGDMPEPGLGMALSVWSGLEAVSFSDSAVVTSTGAALVGIVVVVAAAGAGAGVGAAAFAAGGSPVAIAGAGAGLSPDVDLVVLHFRSLHRELRRRRLSLWARALVASITGWQASPGTRMHLGWDRGAEWALEELGSSFVVDATEAEVGVDVSVVEVCGWSLVLATMGPRFSSVGQRWDIGNLAPVVRPCWVMTLPSSSAWPFREDRPQWRRLSSSYKVSRLVPLKLGWRILCDLIVMDGQAGDESSSSTR